MWRVIEDEDQSFASAVGPSPLSHLVSCLALSVSLDSCMYSPLLPGIMLVRLTPSFPVPPIVVTVMDG